MKKTRRIVVALACLLVLFGIFAAPVSAADYETKNYDVDITVLENNTLLVTETMDVDFSQASHGIYRYIPYQGEVTYQYNGETQVRPFHAKIEDISVPDYETDISYENNNVLVRIGSPDITIVGPLTYQMQYKVVPYEDGIEEFDQVYWGLIPTDTPTPTEKATFRIEMPKSFDESKLAFVAGAYGQADAAAVDWKVDGNTIVGKTNRVLEAGEGVTLRLELPEGYFVDVANNNWMYLIMLLLICLAPLVGALLWFLFGRDQKIVPTVEFYPPEGVSSAEIGYILDDTADNADVVSMILYFAEKGYLEIKEEKEKKFQLIKKRELPAGAKSYEKTMFHGLFKKGDQVNLEDLKEEFYDTFTTVKDLLQGEFSDKKGKKVYTRASKIARAFSFFLMADPLLAIAFLGAGYRYESGFLSIIILPFIAVALLGMAWQISIYDKKDNMKKGAKVGGRLGATIVMAIGLAGVLIYGLLLDILFAAILAAVACLACFFCAAAMKQRTSYSVAMMGKILGFKEFIRTAELPRLQALVEETPGYFYSILPYAYVFGLTDKWVKNFEGIALSAPDWYSSGYNGNMFSTYVFLHSMNNCTRALQSNITIPPMPEGGEGGIGSGGFSGGGISGGGMGGGGMGSW